MHIAYMYESVCVYICVYIQCNPDIRDPDIKEIFLWFQIRAYVT